MKFVTLFILLILTTFGAQAVESIHGMVIFGKERLYASHMPMFHNIHNKQVVITFEVPEAIKNQIVKLQEDQYLSFVPEKFDLEKFIAEPFDLKGDLYVGHFEKDGVIALKGITLSKPKILLMNKLNETDIVSNSESYKFIGTKNDIYALHIIKKTTPVDQIFKLKAIEGVDFDIETIINNTDLTRKDSLQVGDSLTYSTPPGRCPSRLCGEPGHTIATFKVESLYFEDQVM
jgi:hypothetical protein